MVDINIAYKRIYDVYYINYIEANNIINPEPKIRSRMIRQN